MNKQDTQLINKIQLFLYIVFGFNALFNYKTV